MTFKCVFTTDEHNFSPPSRQAVAVIQYKAGHEVNDQGVMQTRINCHVN